MTLRHWNQDPHVPERMQARHGAAERKGHGYETRLDWIPLLVFYSIIPLF